jgi:S1-C subfamily serine protease
MFTAGDLEGGQTCPCCQEPIQTGQSVGRCSACGHLQHEDCWQSAQACRSYECEDKHRVPPERRNAEMVVSTRDLDSATLPDARPQPVRVGEKKLPTVDRRYSRLALASLCVSLLGVVLLGLPALIGIVLGVVALGAINTRRDLRGETFATAGILVGILAVVCWVAGAAVYFSNNPYTPGQQYPANLPDRRRIEPADIDQTSEPIRRAIRANVLVTVGGMTGEVLGAGVIIGRHRDQLQILTNRHVIKSAEGSVSAGRRLKVTFYDAAEQQAQIQWVAPEGLDLALIQCPAPGTEINVATTRHQAGVKVGEPVFAVGNPLGLGWSYADGVVSAIRRLNYSNGQTRMIQTQVPLNPGNSGGGLYSEQGALIGINTLTTDKYVTEGIGFAIAIEDVRPMLNQKLRRAGDQSNEAGDQQ